MGRYKHYVAIARDPGELHSLRYVTSIDNATRCAHWEDGKAAREFTIRSAEDLVFGLTANGYPAMIVKLPSFHEPRNPEVSL